MAKKLRKVSRNGGKPVPGALMSKSPLWAFGAHSYLELCETAENMLPSGPPEGWEAGYLPTHSLRPWRRAALGCCLSSLFRQAWFCGHREPFSARSQGLSARSHGAPMNGGWTLTLSTKRLSLHFPLLLLFPFLC